MTEGGAKGSCSPERKEAHSGGSPGVLPVGYLKQSQQTPGTQYNQWLLGDLALQLWSGGVGTLGPSLGLGGAEQSYW